MNIYTTPIEEILQRLGMSQYRRQFCEEGFDSWETLLDITESDLYVWRPNNGCRTV